MSAARWRSPVSNLVWSGPFRVGDYVLERPCSFGMVFRAGPKRVWVIWEFGHAMVSYHRQTTLTFHRVDAGSWHGNAEYERRSKAEIAKQLANFHQMCADLKAQRSRRA